MLFLLLYVYCALPPTETIVTVIRIKNRKCKLSRLLQRKKTSCAVEINSIKQRISHEQIQIKTKNIRENL